MNDKHASCMTAERILSNLTYQVWRTPAVKEAANADNLSFVPDCTYMLFTMILFHQFCLHIDHSIKT